MLGFRKNGPTQPFSHAADCKLVKINPDIEIPWSEVEPGHWVAECRCGKQHIHEMPDADRRARLDPLNPATMRHAPQCEHRDTSDPALIRLVLDVQDGADPGYWWVTCHACQMSWQVWHYAAKSVG